MSHVDAVPFARPTRFFAFDSRGSERILAALGIAVLAIGGRLVSGWNAPLWFDETFSAVIASQPTPARLIDWCFHEIGGPVYYVLLWIWAHLFGTQATGLRALSLICTLAAPVVAWRLGPASSSVRLYWAALLALWMPSFDYASNARCYGVVLLVNTLQGVAFLRLQRAPTRRNALAWTGLSALGILTHYQTAVLAGVQGLLFLAMHRRTAMRCWPALVALAPMGAWMALHLPILLRFSSIGSWYPPVVPMDLLLAPANFFESALIAVVLVVGWIATLAARWRGWSIDVAPAPEQSVALGGLIALALLLLVSMFKPSFTWRYAAIVAPSILFGVALWMRALKPSLALAPLAIIAMFASSAAGRIALCLHDPAGNYRFAFNLDQPTAWLGETNAHRLGFLWDSPTGTMSDPVRIAEIAGFFPNQAGRPVTVSVLKAWPGSDPRRIVADQVRDGTIDSLVWISDASVPGTLEPADAGTLLRAGWQCRDFGRRPITVLACRDVAPITISRASFQ